VNAASICDFFGSNIQSFQREWGAARSVRSQPSHRLGARRTPANPCVSPKSAPVITEGRAMTHRLQLLPAITWRHTIDHVLFPLPNSIGPPLSR
jgi:hypothetical protein